MKKREYIQANKDWLLAKSKEEGVKPLPRGIYIRYWQKEISPATRPMSAV